ncbi:unnamed protein product [Lasius platythorax]|uniref:Uncharacterized protein n=1 Tax=Lasius platythorax TaxID=488582 RepID=A0AAV2NCA5_9HYME
MKNNGLGSRKAALQARTVTIISGTISPDTNERTWIIASPLRRPRRTVRVRIHLVEKILRYLACRFHYLERSAFPTCVTRRPRPRLVDRRNDNVTSDKSPLFGYNLCKGDRLNGGKKSSNACGLVRRVIVAGRILMKIFK